ncbi:LOW QUALITY PROTEIN: hypothetical protein PHMEG_0001786 [Phytophthora megakarya]|uniref:Retroviral polymerase SH3-like domain-containing protein n=1 Tax=Phytophthora megakarya TaxID=4795 RepID=A0A225X0D0_9STRA|nr:LOW QUALITY PROTEIN: hypothetical protein PHMEG_0001786 [Phytophthora megakarya]
MACWRKETAKDPFIGDGYLQRKEMLLGFMETLRTHHNIWGPHHVDSYLGKRCFGVFVDESFSTLVLLAERSEIYEKFETYYEQAKTHLNVRMKEFRCDNAKELIKLSSICEQKFDMECTSTIKHTPEQNGVAERMIRTSVLNRFHLPEELWADAAMTATYYINIVANSTKDMEVPYAVWYRELPSYSRLRTFGCAALLYVDKVERRKMHAKAREVIFFGYSRAKHGYRMLDCNTRKAICSHTAVFYGNKPGHIAAGPEPLLNITMSIQQYLNVDSSVMKSIPAMLDEMHEEDNSDVDCEASEVQRDRQQVGQMIREVPGQVGLVGQCRISLPSGPI